MVSTKTKAAKNGALTGRISTDPLNGVTNGAASSIAFSEPYVVSVTIKGVADILFHRWNVEGVDEKAAAKKGSASKKTDDIESYVYRLDPTDPASNLAIPAEYLRMAILGAAKFRQDPRSPRKSATDLYKAAIAPLTPLADLGVDTWDYVDRRRVQIQRNGINRSRPALRAGWEATFELQVLIPEYVSESDLNEVIATAGRLVGIADFRPTYGRFQITNFRRLS